MNKSSKGKNKNREDDNVFEASIGDIGNSSDASQKKERK